MGRGEVTPRGLLLVEGDSRSVVVVAVFIERGVRGGVASRGRGGTTDGGATIVKNQRLGFLDLYEATNAAIPGNWMSHAHLNWDCWYRRSWGSLRGRVH